MTTPLNALATVAALIATAIGAAAEIQAVGAVRPEHDTKWQGLRVTLDQANDAVMQVTEEVFRAAIPSPDAAAYAQLGERVGDMEHTLARLVELANTKAA